MPLNALPNGALTLLGRIPQSSSKPEEERMTDLLYLAGGVAVLLLFAAYAVLLKRA
jgi:hypothetical protein